MPKIAVVHSDWMALGCITKVRALASTSATKVGAQKRGSKCANSIVLIVSRFDLCTVNARQSPIVVINNDVAKNGVDELITIFFSAREMMSVIDCAIPSIFLESKCNCNFRRSHLGALQC